MLDKNIMLALNGADDAFLEETARKLGYNTETKERIVSMTNYNKRTSRRFISILIAATLVLSLGIVAYATELFGIKALLIKNTGERAVPEDFSAMVSITQPQEVPEEMDSGVKNKIANSAKAWEEWEIWSKTNGPVDPEVFAGPEGFSGVADYIENEDGSYTIVYSTIEPGTDGQGWTYQEVERRTATAEEYEQHMNFMDAVSMGFEGYDFNYNVYSQEMADKLEEIAAKYGLNVRHKHTLLLQNFGKNTGAYTLEQITAEVNRVCCEGNSFFQKEPTGYDKFYYYDEGTFAVSFYTTDDLTNMGTSCYLYNSPYSTLSSGFEIVGLVKDIDAMESYTHTSPDGTELTVLHNGADMYAYVYLENSFVTMTFHQTEGLSSDEINSIIDMVNFSAIK